MRCRKVLLRIKLIRAGHKIGFLPAREKNYLNDLVCLVAPENGATQDALIWAVTVDHFHALHLVTPNPEHDAWRLAQHCEAIVARYNAYLIQRESLDIMLAQITRIAA